MNSRNKSLILTGIILLVVGLAVFVVGFWLQGFDFKAYFQSQSFIIICVLLGLYTFGAVAFVVYDKIKKL